MPDLSADRPLPLPKSDLVALEAELDRLIGSPNQIDTANLAEDLLDFLARSGRLLPSSAEHREEWGVRMEWVQGPMDLNCADRETAEDYIVSLSPLHRGIAKLVRRVAGPWVEADRSPE